MSSENRYWLWAKVSFSFFWLTLMVIMVSASPQVAVAVGICHWVSFDPLFAPTFQPLLYVLLVVLTLLYVLEKKMLWTTLGMAVLTLVIISQHESSGQFFRATSYTVILAVQFLAYAAQRFKPEFDLGFYRLQFPVQIIAATYTLAALSKLQVTGLEWVNSGHLFSLQVIKNEAFRYFDTGNAALMAQAQAKADWFLAHRNLVTMLLSSSLLLELLCPVVLIGLRVRMVYGGLLTAMHLGIYLVMGIVIGGIAFNMIIFFINPMYYLAKVLGLLFKPNAAE
jgi:hypothetical protein